ncbi:MAG: hypothetical protein PHD13_02250 [Methanocellales archaeon]|nr:hypothetical protein [Methanocellales archaeon]MDD3291095.1 hypothetical protein [Methanocellales archaeon]MDD5234980.1 hypothetical protein [Methanocellales archaeon]MDD5484649.1 hypothetical protein [Methanocellales archaeon]
MNPSEFYTKLYSKISELGISSPVDMDFESRMKYLKWLNRHLDKESRGECERIIFQHYMDNWHRLRDFYKDAKGFRCHYDIFEMGFQKERIDLDAINIFAKKAASYSSVILLSSNRFTFNLDNEKAILGGPIWEILFCLSPLLLSNSALYLPSTIRTATYNSSFTRETGLPDTPYQEYVIPKLGESYLGDVYVKYNSHSSSKLWKHLLSDKRVGWQYGIPTLFVPTLHGLTLDDVVKIRENEKESFGRYQLAITQFVRKLTGHKDDLSLSEVVEEVSNESVRLYAQLKDIKKELKFKGLSITLGGVVCFLMIAYPEPITKMVASIVGAKSVLDGISFITEYSASKNMLEDYAFAMKLACRSKDFENIR